VRFLLRLLLLPVRVVLASVAVGFRAGQMVARVPMRISSRIGRLMGWRAVLALLAGLAIGVLFAPGPGRELRDRLQALAAGRRGSGASGLADRVAFELQHAPRTWHLPQPKVSVSAGEVTLSGRVDGDAARDELGRVAAAVPGVVRVDNLIVVGAATETGQD
jgi:BON domain